MYTNVDQLTPLKKSKLKELITQQKPQIIAICEVKPKNGVERTLQDYAINGYTMHHVNIDSTVGRGIAIYVNSSIAKFSFANRQSNPLSRSFVLEIQLHSPTPNNASDENNDNLNRALKSLALSNKYSHKCFVSDFNFKTINWNTCSSPYDEFSKEEKFLEAICDCFLHQNVLEPAR